MADGDLTTIEKVRAHISIKGPDADAILSDLISSSSAWVIGRLGRSIFSAIYTDVQDGDGGSRILLDQCRATPDSPPVSVTSVTVDGSVIVKRPAVTTQNTNPDGWIYQSGGIDLVGSTFTRGYQNVTVVYSVGYDACPLDLEQAVREHVALRYQDRGREGLSSTSSMGESVSFTASSGSLAYINGVLDRYRALGVG